jgi:hypothetical protein
LYRPSKTFYEQKPSWKDPTNAVTTPIKTIHDNFRNASRENSTKLMHSSSKFGQGLYVNQLVMQSRMKV